MILECHKNNEPLIPAGCSNMNPIFYFFSKINESEYKFSLWLINIILFSLDPNYLKIKVSENKLYA